MSFFFPGPGQLANPVLTPPRFGNFIDVAGKITQPGAGSEVKFTVSPVSTGNTAIWTLRSMQIQLVTSSTAGNRSPVILITPSTTATQNTDRAFSLPPTPLVGLSLTRTFDILRGYPLIETTFDSGGFWRCPFPDFPLPNGTVISTKTGALANNDQYAIQSMVIEEWPANL